MLLIMVHYSLLSKNLIMTDYFEQMWDRLDENQKEVVCYLVHASPPISIDALISLTGKPEIITVLNVVEGLRKKKIVCEKKGYQKGLYFLVDTDFGKFIRKSMSQSDTAQVIRALIEYYIQSLSESREKTLILAELYHRHGDMNEGLNTIKKAADILLQFKDEKRAIVYYDHILKQFETKEPVRENVELFVESVLAKLSTSTNMIAHEQTALLEKVEEIARQHEKWELVARIKHELISELLLAGDTEQGAKNINAFSELALKVGDPSILKKAALARSELCFWQGRLSEAIRSYEDVTGDMEEFGEDTIALMDGAIIGWCYVMCGRIARGMGMLNAVREKALMLGFLRTAHNVDVLKAHALLDLRKISEAEAILDISEVPSSTLNIYDRLISYIAVLCKAYICFAKEDYEGLSACLQNATKALPSLGWIPRQNPWDFERLIAMESRGLFPETTSQAAVEKWANGNDIYIKGFAVRYRALINMEKHGPSAQVLADLRKSEEYLKEVGAEIELARTRLALGKYYLTKGDEKLARSCLGQAWHFFSGVDKSLFPADLMGIMPKEEKMEFMVNRMGEITRSLGTIRDRSSFLNGVLNVAMDFTMATRGGFFVSNSDELSLIASRNIDPSYNRTETFKVIKQTILNAQHHENREVVLSTVKGGDKVTNLSVRRPMVSPLVAMPAKLGETLYGYLYLDKRFDDTPFPEDHLPFIRMLCDQIAVGLSNISMYEEMKRLKDHFQEEASFYKQGMGVETPLEMIVGQSEAIQKITREIRQVANTDASVLILGETGVGKELVAKAIHGLSERRNSVFIPVNLATLPSELVASELFGHEKGSFTGAHEMQKGLFEFADGGTIFLDEIGDLPPNIQVKLLRILQEGTFERLGGSKPIKSNFRVISATNKDLHKEVQEGAFRQDLYFRLNVFPIYIAPLRERKDDIPLLVRFFIDKHGRKQGKAIKRIPRDELRRLINYHWPGNVRELEHVVERAIIFSDGGRISFKGFEYLSENITSATDIQESYDTLADVERNHVIKVLNSTNWKVSGPHGAAMILGLKSSTLVFRMKKLGIKRS